MRASLGVLAAAALLLSGCAGVAGPAEPVVPSATADRYPVVATNAVEATVQVLSSLESPFPSAEEIAASITALLEKPEGEFETAAPPSVEIDDEGRVGVGMGGPNDCVLVKFEDGVVEQLYAAPVLLQPGELGCSGGTALYPDLSSPH